MLWVTGWASHEQNLQGLLSIRRGGGNQVFERFSHVGSEERGDRGRGESRVGGFYILYYELYSRKKRAFSGMMKV